MLYRTTKLKRYKVLVRTLDIVFIPIRLPLVALYLLGKAGEYLHDILVVKPANWIKRTVVKTLKWDEIKREER